MTVETSDPATLFKRLREVAVAKGVSEFPTYTPESTRSPFAYARRVFAALLHSLEGGFSLIFDDWHEIPDEGSVSEVLPALLAEVPEECSFIVISRHGPPPSLARSSVNSEIRHLTGDQLAFDEREALALAKLVDSPLSENDVRSALRECRGWAAGLRLQLEQGVVLSVSHPGSATGTRELHEYFAREVFARVSPAAQNFLLRTATPGSLTPALAQDLTEIDASSSARILRSLASRGCFLVLRDAARDEYQYHPWFRRFLLAHARTALEPGEADDLCQVAASWYVRNGNADAAARVLTDGALFEQFALLILGQAPALLAGGRHQTLAAWIDQLPGAIVATRPWLLYWRGQSAAIHSPLSALDWLQRAFAGFCAVADPAGQLLSWAGIVDAILRGYGSYARLDEWIARFDLALAPMLESVEPSVRERTVGSLFPALSFRQPDHPRLPGLVAEVEVMVRRDEPIAATTHLLTSLHAHYLWTGNIAVAATTIERLRMVRRQPFASPLEETSYQLCEATHALFTGQHDVCLRAVESGLKTASENDIHIWDAVLLGHGVAVAASRGDAELEERFLARAHETMNPHQHRERSRLLLAQAWLDARRGSCRQATVEASTGVVLEAENGAPFFLACAELMAGMTFALCDDVDAARGHMQRVGEAADRLRNRMLSWMGHLGASYVELRAGRDDAALAELRAGLEIGAAEGFRHFLFWPREPLAELCGLAIAHAIEPRYVAGLISQHRFPPPPAIAYSERWPWPVVVRAMGPFLIAIDGRPLLPTGKAQRVPLRLLKFLIARGGNAVPIQDVIDHLWPDAEGDAGEQALATTLNRLRRIVGDAAIRRSDRRLSIDAEYCWVDALALRQLLETWPSSAGRQAFERIRALAKGPFLAGEPDASWAISLRDRLHDLLIQRLLELASAEPNRVDVELTDELFRFGLDVDELVEPFYRGLMANCIERSETAQALAHFRRCERALKTQLGCGPSRATLQLRDVAKRQLTR